MITTPTTFVVGAGASTDYGLPTSADLREEADFLRHRNPVAYKLILEAELCSPEQLNRIVDDLSNQGTSSIDEFLFARQHDPLTMKVGRALIALLLGRRLNEVKRPHSLGAGPTDWLGYIINKMQSGAPNCDAFVEGNTQVRFVTFNFDSIIEDRLNNAICNLYRGAPERRLKEAVSAIHRQVIHVHGRLPLPPDIPLPEHDFNDWGEWTAWLKSAPSEIRLVKDQFDPSILADALEAVQRSRILCFLGFAYARDNLAKLGLPKALHLGLYGQKVYRDIYGTTYRMGKGEIASVMDKLAGAELGDGSERCLGFLRDHHIFRD